MQYPHNQSVEIVLEGDELIVMEIFKKHKTYIILKPPLLIKNCIQQNIQIVLNDKVVNLVQNQIYEDYQFNQSQKVKVALFLDQKVNWKDLVRNNNQYLLNGDQIHEHNETQKCQKI